MAGRLVQVATHTVTSAVSSITLTGINTDDVYELVCTNLVCATDDKDFLVRVTNGGTARTASNYFECTKNLRTDTTFSNSSISNGTQFQPFSALGSDTGESGNVVMQLYNFNNSSFESFMTMRSNYITEDPILFGMQGGGYYDVNEANDGVNLSWESSANFESGTATLYRYV